MSRTKPNSPSNQLFKGVSDANRDDRTWPHGRQHGPAASRGQPPMRGLRQVAEGGRGVDSGQGRRSLVDRGSREEAGDATDGLADGSGGGNSYYVDDIRRARELSRKGIHYVDVGTSGGVWGLERGYCLMIGGEAAVVKHLDPIFAELAPGSGDISRTPGRAAIGGN